MNIISDVCDLFEKMDSGMLVEFIEGNEEKGETGSIELVTKSEVDVEEDEG